MEQKILEEQNLPESPAPHSSLNRLLRLIAVQDPQGNARLRGQSLVIVAIMLVLLIGMLALSIDGGNSFWNRRNAQNAADAGAMAGARMYCTTPGTVAQKNTAAINGASEYTITRNRADSANINVNNSAVTVTANITFTNFFAGVLGYPQGNVSAIASAACCPPGGGAGVLPIAWSCRPPVGGFGDSEDCSIAYGKRYIVMDSEGYTEDLYCQDPPNSGLPAGALDCDFNDDQVNDVMYGSGGRSWLDLNGDVSSTSEINNWIDGTEKVTVNFPYWLPDKTGVAGSTFLTVAGALLNRRVLIPVFDAFCEGRPDINPNNCPGKWQAGDGILPVSATSTLYFRVASVAMFYIDCVDTGGGSTCPGKQALIDANPGEHLTSLKTIEGYFVQGFTPGGTGGDCNGIDVGVYTLGLTQ